MHLLSSSTVRPCMTKHHKCIFFLAAHTLQYKAHAAPSYLEKLHYLHLLCLRNTLSTLLSVYQVPILSLI